MPDSFDLKNGVSYAACKERINKKNYMSVAEYYCLITYFLYLIVLLQANSEQRFSYHKQPIRVCYSST